MCSKIIYLSIYACLYTSCGDTTWVFGLAIRCVEETWLEFLLRLLRIHMRVCPSCLCVCVCVCVSVCVCVVTGKCTAHRDTNSHVDSARPCSSNRQLQIYAYGHVRTEIWFWDATVLCFEYTYSCTRLYNGIWISPALNDIQVDTRYSNATFRWLALILLPSLSPSQVKYRTECNPFDGFLAHIHCILAVHYPLVPRVQKIKPTN